MMNKRWKVWALLLFIGLTTQSMAQSNTFPSSGNVGIGTTSPSSLLEVEGDIAAIPQDGSYFSNFKAFESVYRGGNSGTNLSSFVFQNHVDHNSGSNNRYGMLRVALQANYNSDNTFETAGIDVFGDNYWESDRRYMFIHASSVPIAFSSGYTEKTSRTSLLQNSDIQMILTTSGNLGIGTTSPDVPLTVNGTAKAKEIIVEENIGADFVFTEDYELPKLKEIESHIQKHRHLQGIPSAEEMKTNGVKVGDLQMKLLQKIEELTLYAIEMKKSNTDLKQEINKLTERVRELEKDRGE